MVSGIRERKAGRIKNSIFGLGWDGRASLDFSLVYRGADAQIVWMRKHWDISVRNLLVRSSRDLYRNTPKEWTVY